MVNRYLNSARYHFRQAARDQETWSAQLDRDVGENACAANKGKAARHLDGSETVRPIV
jgi:hypothetical protein